MDRQIVTHTINSICKHQDLPFSFQSRPKRAAFWSNIDSLNTPPPVLRVQLAFSHPASSI